MRILQICARIPYPVEDGGSVYVFNTTKYLSKLGHDVHLASFYSELHSQDPEAIKKYCKIYHEKGDFKSYSFFSVIKATITRKPISIQHRMKPKIMKGILATINSEFDLIIFEGLHTLNFLRLVKEKFPNTPVLLRHVNVEFELLKLNAKNESNILKKLFLNDQSRLMRKFELDMLTKVDALTFISEKDANKLTKLVAFSTPFLINPPGAEADYPIDFEKRGNCNLIAFSNWKWTPNIDGLNWFLKNIWKALKKQHPEVKLTLAGNDLPEYLKNELPADISYLGFVENISELNKKHAIQIVPLISGSGVKLKVIEGLSFGNPIVSTSFGVDGINVENGIHFELADTPNEFLSKISMLLNNKERRKKLSENSTELIANQYSWEKQIKSFEIFIKQLIQSQ